MAKQICRSNFRQEVKEISLKSKNFKHFESKNFKHFDTVQHYSGSCLPRLPIQVFAW